MATVLDIYQFSYFRIILWHQVHGYPEMFIIKMLD